jgi:hypothetical protein
LIISVAMAEPISPARDAKLEAAFERWATQNPSEALTALAGVREPPTRRAIALVLLDVLGNDELGRNRIAATLPPIDAVNFAIDAIVREAEQDLRGAFQAAAALPDQSHQRLALSRLASQFARQDPLSAIAWIKELNSPSLVSEALSSLIDEWAMIDPIQAFNYLETADKKNLTSMEIALQIFAEQDPKRLLGVVDEFPSAFRTQAQTSAIVALVGRDSNAALAYVDALPDSSRLKIEFGKVYGSADPESALKWAQAQPAASSSSPSPADPMLAVLLGVRSVDPDRALEFVLSDLASPIFANRTAMNRRLSSFLADLAKSETATDVTRTFDRITELGSAENMDVAVLAWARHDADSAVDWAIRNVDHMDDPYDFANLGSSLARTDLKLAQDKTYLLPTDLRGPWVGGVMRAMAADDLAIARSWALSFPRGSMRDEALRSYLAVQASSGSVESPLINAIDDESVRLRAITAVAETLACDYPEVARRIIEDEVSAGETKEQLRERFAWSRPNSMCAL